jgi:hypothetical protein
MKKIWLMVPAVWLTCLVLLTMVSANCPYSGIGRTTYGTLIRGNATHEVVNGQLVPKEEVVRDDGLFWQCEDIIRNQTKVRDCRLYERIEFVWNDSEPDDMWQCDEEEESIYHPIQLWLGEYIFQNMPMLVEMYLRW